VVLPHGMSLLTAARLSSDDHFSRSATIRIPDPARRCRAPVNDDYALAPSA
jgi:hypothetical protein